MKANITQRRYNILTDFSRVYDFLEETYDFETLNSYLLPQFFEYAQHLIWFDYIRTHRIGLWEHEGKVVGISAYEMEIGKALLHTRKEYEFLLPDLLKWAETELAEVKDGEKSLHIWTTEKEHDKNTLLETQGYEQVYQDAITIFDYKKPFLERQLPIGFKLIDGTNIDYEKLGTCFWRGFNNKGDAPENNADGNMKVAHAPHADKSLMTIVVAPNGEYACALGMWYDERNKYAYLEPMATVPEYRRLGLGTTALMEAMKKTKVLGATYCFGGPVMDFYPLIGFEVKNHRMLWKKRFDN